MLCCEGGVKREKRLDRLRRSGADVAPEELEELLLGFGFGLRLASGSHRVYGHPALSYQLSIPYRRPLKAVYVRQALAAIDHVRRLDDEDRR